jgi:signal peptidase I
MNSSDFVFSDAHALQCELAGEILQSRGRLRLGVTGWSMLPTVWPGDVLVIEATNRDAVRAGDIVLFGRERRFFVHRVVDKSEGEQKVQTRGDAMPRMDPPVSDRELLGRVVRIERNGKSVEPSREFNGASRSVAALVRHSPTAARVVVKMHEMLQSL